MTRHNLSKGYEGVLLARKVWKALSAPLPRWLGPAMLAIVTMALSLSLMTPVAQAQTGNVDINCRDPQDPGTCSVSDPKFSNLLGSLFNTVSAIRNSGSCTITGATSATCSAPDGTTLVCANITATSASCTVPSGETISCTGGTATSASCVVTAQIQPPSTPTPPPPSNPTQADIDKALQANASTPPQRAVAGVIGTVCPKNIASANFQRDCNALIGGVLKGESGTSNALAQVTPAGASTPVNASLNSVNVQSRNVGARLTALRRGATGLLNLGGLGLNLDGRWISGKELADLVSVAGQRGGAASADSTDSGFNRLGIFVNGNINKGNMDTTANETGFDFTTWGITAGLDYRFSDNFILGGAFGYVDTNTDLKANGGGLDGDSYSLTLYGTYYQSDRFYLDGSLGYGWNRYNQDRNIRYALEPQNTLVDQTLSTDFNGSQFTATLGGGYDLNSGAWTFGPVGQLQYVKANVDGYQERASNPSTNGSGWTVAIDSQDYNSFTLSLGGQVSYALSQSWGVLLPQARFEWVHEFDSDSPFVAGHFVGDPSRETFRFAGDKPDTNYFNLGLGVSAVFAKGRSAYFNYQTVLGYNDLTNNSFNVGMRLEF